MIRSSKLTRLLIANRLAILGFFLLYLPFSPRPYSNLLYFFLMLSSGIYLARETNYQYLKKTKTAFYVTSAGIVIMLAAYSLMRLSYYFFATHPVLAAKVDTNQWHYFVKPWVEMNRFLSVSGVILIVVALEFFYRSYMQEFFSQHISLSQAIFLTALLSGIRGAGGGSLAGPIDFLLALVWGWVYYYGGLLPAILVHLCWDIPFVYFAP